MAPRVQLKDDREMKYDLIFIQWSNHSMNSKVGPNKDFRILNHQMNLAHSFAKKTVPQTCASHVFLGTLLTFC